MNISAYKMQGRRAHMEDYYDIAYKLKPSNQQRVDEWPYEYIYFGIFDGHGGYEAAQFTRENLLKFITNKPEFWSDNDDDVMRAIQMGFAETHAVMKTKMTEWTRTSRVLPSTAGTTASVLFIRNGKFYTGHVGDSRIVISQENPETKQWISDQVTEDHKPESEAEMARIERAGGEVRSKIGVHRVVWRRPVLKRHIGAKLCADPKPDDYDHYLQQVPSYPVQELLVDNYQIIPFLAIARSLGDFWSINPYSGQYIVSPEPDVSCRPISPNDRCILLATDGLWNVMNSSQAVRALQELKVVRKGKRDCEPYDQQYFYTDNFYDIQDGDNHALSLVYMAYQIWERRRLRSDNISAVVAMLSDIIGPYQKSIQNRITKTPNKTYSTRASEHINNQHVNELSKLPDRQGPTQLEPTIIFCEKLRLNQAPVFERPIDDHSDFFWKLRDFLVLPPTILEAEMRAHNELAISRPRNYELLASAKLRIWSKPDRSGRPQGGQMFYLKEVSDDPDDRTKATKPTYRSKSGKQVKDASAQATQQIHDFGQPWDQLSSSTPKTYNDLKEHVESLNTYDDDEEDEDEDDASWLFFGHDGDDDDDDDDEYDDDDAYEKFKESGKIPLLDGKEQKWSAELVKSLMKEKVEDNDVGHNETESTEVAEKDQLVLIKAEKKTVDSELIFDNDGKLIYDDDYVLTNDDDDNVDIAGNKSPIKNQQINDLSMPHLRCLMNCNSATPTLRRSTRSGAYLSLTENSKRRSQPSPSLPKSKRRKSHPVQCSIDLAT